MKVTGSIIIGLIALVMASCHKPIKYQNRVAEDLNFSRGWSCDHTTFQIETSRVYLCFCCALLRRNILRLYDAGYGQYSVLYKSAARCM